jgi:hypothetical protein
VASSTHWITESNDIKQTVTSVLAVTTGIALAIGFSHFEGPGLTGSLAGFLLGLLLLFVGLASLLFGGKQVITVDTKRCRIVIEGKNRFSESTKVIRFNEIADVYVGEFGDQEGGTISYHVVVKLKTGKEIRLFFAFFDGQHDKSVAESRCQRLAQCLKTSG